MSGQVYSANYAKFYGTGTSYAPVLTVTYELEGETLTAESTFEVNDSLGVEINVINLSLERSANVGGAMIGTAGTSGE